MIEVVHRFKPAVTGFGLPQPEMAIGISQHQIPCRAVLHELTEHRAAIRINVPPSARETPFFEHPFVPRAIGESYSYFCVGAQFVVVPRTGVRIAFSCGIDART